jgi:tripartite-type tricarboxylate transporter receptor subunit TctC
VPDVPAAVESGLVPGFDVTTWYGVFGPPGMPAPVVERLNQTLLDSIADDKVRDRMVTAGVVVKGSTSAAFGAFMAGEFKRWNEVREKAGIAQQ